MLLGWIIRSVVLFWRGRSPRIQITPFGWAAGEGDRESLWVTALFRDHLKALRLDSLDAVPDRAPGAPLVEIVEGVAGGVGQKAEWGKLMGRLWRAAVPDCAYEVWATLKPCSEGRGSISLQLIKRSGGNRALVSFTSEEADWDTCARTAAMAAAGALYPHLSKRHKGPWAEWTKPVPPELLGLYQGALKHEQSHQFEQALCGFRETVEKDPLNPQLRLKVAMLEERLGLHLGAWFTYWAIVAESDRRLWKGPHRRTRLVALYRFAIHLWNPQVADEWIRHDRTGNKLRRLRAELHSTLRREGALADGGGTSPELSLEPFHDGYPLADRRDRIAEVLQSVSLDRLEELRERMSRRRTRGGPRWPRRRCRRRPLRRWLLPSELPPLAVEASKVLVRMHLASSTERRLRSQEEDVSPELKSVQAELARHWPFPGWEDNHRVAKLRRRARVWLGDRRDDAWQLHYNAACTIAAQLSAIKPGGNDSEWVRWVKAAVDQLELFSYYAGSARVAAMADWIALEDPDLEHLYGDELFKLWGSQRFGFGLPERRPSRTVLDRHTVLILKRSAAAFAVSWRDRAATPSVAPASLLRWWTEELEIWERLRQTCDDHRSWRCRLEGFQALEHWNAENGPVGVAFGREKRGHWIRAEALRDDLLADLLVEIGTDGNEKDGMVGWVAARAAEVATSHDVRLRSVGARGVGVLRPAERRAALEVADSWSALEATLATALRQPETATDWSALRRVRPGSRADART